MAVSPERPTGRVRGPRRVSPSPDEKGSGATARCCLHAGGCSRDRAFAGLQTPDNSATLHLMSQFGRILGQLGWPFEMMPAGALYLVGRSIYSQASMMAFSDAFLFMALLYFVTMIPALFLIDLPIKAKLPIILRPRHG